MANSDYLVEWRNNSKELSIRNIPVSSPTRVYHEATRVSFGFVIVVKAASIGEAASIGTHYIEERYGKLN